MLGHDHRGPLVARWPQLEDQVGRRGIEGDVADLVDHDQWDPLKTRDLLGEPPGALGLGESGHPLGGGREGHPPACQAARRKLGAGAIDAGGPGVRSGQFDGRFLKQRCSASRQCHDSKDGREGRHGSERRTTFPIVVRLPDA